MIRRKTIRIPGYDCITGECPHEPKGDHGRHGEEVHHAVITELPDGRMFAVALVIYTDKFPASYQPSDDLTHLYPGGSHGTGIFTHTQLPRVPHQVDCPFVGDFCAAHLMTSLGGETLWNKHKTGDQEATEELWRELEELLSQLVNEGIDP